MFSGLALVVAGGFAWYERARPPARLVALVAALAALAIAGRLALAPIPNVVATTDIALLTGYALGGAPGFAVGALAAPISNIWLGQGPWTAWQMAGWGLIGLSGAWLATASRRGLGRWGLAIACGLAGLAYGALLDLSVMVTYGGEQSLDRYLALSARGIPFNVAHAAGNFAIAFVAGPALVRMISRYRTRLEFTWRAAGALPLALVALTIAGIPPPATTKAEPARAHEKGGAATAAARWLARTQNVDGGFGATADDPSSPAMTGWVMLGLEAADRNPLDVRRKGETAVSYLRSEVDRLRSSGDFERTILALEGAGLDPRGFAGVDLVSELRSRRDRDGSLDGQVNLTAFFVLALRAAGAETGDLGRPARWLRGAQNANGGWGFRPDAPSDPDSTGAALQALAAAGSGGDATSDGVRWLRNAQRGDGGYALATNGVVNSQSTSWAVQGLLAAGGSDGAVDQALDHLDSRRSGDGHYRYSRTSDQTPVWVTAQALLAIEHQPFPVPPAARRPSESTGSDGASGDGGSGGGSIAPTIAPPVAPDSGLSGPVVSGSELGGIPGGFAGSGGGAAASGSGAGDPNAGRVAHRGQAEGSGAGGEGAGEGEDGPDLGTVAERIIAASTEPSPPTTADDEPVAPYVAGGLGLLALALGGGFLWYRRTLP